MPWFRLDDSFNRVRSIVAGACLVVFVVQLGACSRGGDSAPVQSPAQFSGLGLLPGYASSQASSISADGSAVAGTASTSGGSSQAFRWTASQGVSALGFLPGGSRSSATGISADGTVVVGTGDSSGAPPTPAAAFRWSAATGVQRIDGPANSLLCTANGVSGDGATVAGTCLSFNNEAFRWTSATGAIGLGRFGGGSDQTSSATAIASSAAAIVGAGHPVLTGAVLWPATGAAIVLGKLPGDATASALAVSRDGTVVVGVSTDNDGNARAFRWTQATGLSALAGAGGTVAGSFASAVSGDGRVIVGWIAGSTGEAAMIWDADHGLRLLENALASDYGTAAAGWRLSRATAISDDGRAIAGYGMDPQGRMQAWIVKLPQ